jgi:hypothetical protein
MIFLYKENYPDGKGDDQNREEHESDVRKYLFWFIIPLVFEIKTKFVTM